MESIQKCINDLNAVDVFFNIVLYVFKVCGIAPINFVSETTPRTNVSRVTIAYARSMVVYNSTMLMFMVTVNTFAIYYYKISDYINEIMFFAGDTFGFISAVCVVGWFTVKHKTLINILNDMNEIRRNVSASHCKDGKRYVVKKIKWLILIYVLVWLGLVVTTTFHNIYHILVNFFLNVCHFILNALLVHYCIAIQCVNYLLFELNNSLLCTLKRANPTSILKTNKDLLKLWEAYADLINVSRDVSNFYSFSMIFIVTDVLLNSITSLYYIIGKSMIGKRQYAIILEAILFVLGYACPYVILTTFVTATTNESRRTRGIVNDQLRRLELREVEGKLSQFFIYLLHGDVEFTVYDFFPLNGSFLVSVIGTVITYLVILLQFQQNKCTSDDE